MCDLFFFFFNDTATTENYTYGHTLSLHDARPIYTLTVVATESYETFADNLQKEIEADTGIRFGIVEQHQFAAIPIQKDDGTLTMLGFEESTSILDRKSTRLNSSH